MQRFHRASVLFSDGRYTTWLYWEFALYWVLTSFHHALLPSKNSIRAVMFIWRSRERIICAVLCTVVHADIHMCELVFVGLTLGFVFGDVLARLYFLWIFVAVELTVSGILDVMKGSNHCVLWLSRRAAVVAWRHGHTVWRHLTSLWGVVDWPSSRSRWTRASDACSLATAMSWTVGHGHCRYVL